MKSKIENKKEASSLLISKSETKEKLKKRLEEGIEIKNTAVQSEQELDVVRQKYKKWSDFNVELLSRIFNNESIAIEYESSFGSSRVVPDPLFGNPFPTLYENFQNGISAKINELESIIERLELIPEITKIQSPESGSELMKKFNSHKVFIVHGHDEEAKQSVARVIEKLGLEAIILHERPNKGRTIVSKFEDYSDVGFVVVLLTPDDVGASKDTKENLNDRPRQNAIFELGFFIGRLGSERVCAIRKGELELPSDYQGVLFIDMDPNRSWTFSLARELKDVGFKIDLNKLA